MKMLSSRLGKCAVFFIAGIAAVGTLRAFGVRLNTTESLPLGLYVASKTGDLVAFCPEEPWAKLSMERGYRGPGACADGGMPLLKPVVARAGDTVIVAPEGILVNGNMLENSAALHQDHEGREMKSYPAGVYRVGQDQVWVISSYNARSFDSRYYGPVKKSSIVGAYRSLVTW